MVREWIFIALLVPFFLVSGEFTATVSRNEVGVKESFTLMLTLKGVSPQEAPMIEPLKSAFYINSQHQASHTTITNGTVSSSTSWKLALTPQSEGDLTIPSISINTSEGILFSAPIKIKAVTGNVPSSETSGLTLKAEVNRSRPYKSEPFLYTIRLLSKDDLVNVGVQKLTLDEALVEQNGEPKISRKVVDGVFVHDIELSYLITPLKEGTLIIPSLVVQGGIPSRKRPPKGTFFDEEYDPIFALHGFDRITPFTLVTEEKVIEVLPPIAGMNPWLPARLVKLEETWDASQTLKMGEPLSRGIKIVAEGAISSQLPSLSELQIAHPGFKIYWDQAERKDETKNDTLHSFRKEQYTLIPQASGALTLPEISIEWWDVTKNEKAVARLPARVVDIAPSEPITYLEDQKVPHLVQEPEVKRDPLLYILIGSLTLLCLAALFWAISLQKKVTKLTQTPQRPLQPVFIDEDKPLSSPLEKKEKLPDLNPT